MALRGSKKEHLPLWPSSNRLPTAQGGFHLGELQGRSSRTEPGVRGEAGGIPGCGFRLSPNWKVRAKGVRRPASPLTAVARMQRGGQEQRGPQAKAGGAYLRQTCLPPELQPSRRLFLLSGGG